MPVVDKKMAMPPTWATPCRANARSRSPALLRPVVAASMAPTWASPCRAGSPALLRPVVAASQDPTKLFAAYQDPIICSTTVCGLAAWEEAELPPRHRLDGDRGDLLPLDIEELGDYLKYDSSCTADCYKKVPTGVSYDEDPLFFKEKERNDFWEEPLISDSDTSDDDWYEDSCPLKDITHDLMHGSDVYEYPSFLEQRALDRAWATRSNPYQTNKRVLDDIHRDLVRGEDRRRW